MTIEDVRNIYKLAYKNKEEKTAKGFIYALLHWKEFVREISKYLY